MTRKSVFSSFLLLARNTFNLVIPFGIFDELSISFTENSNSDDLLLSPLKTLHLTCNVIICMEVKNKNNMVSLVARMKNLTRDYFWSWVNIKLIKLINLRMIITLSYTVTMGFFVPSYDGVFCTIIQDMTVVKWEKSIVNIKETMVLFIVSGSFPNINL